MSWIVRSFRLHAALWLGLGVLAVAVAATPAAWDWQMRVAVAWDVSASVFLLLTLARLRRARTADAIRRRAAALDQAGAAVLPLSLLAAAAPWQPGRGDINLGNVRMARTGVLFSSSQGQASRLINGLLDGRSTVVRNYAGEAGRPMEVRVLPVSFAKAYSDYQACAGKLLAMNYDQVRQTQVGFPGGGIELDEAAKARLDLILDYMKADPTVNHIELDGHSDNSGNRLTNRDLSRRRALSVADYFKAHGLKEEQIIVRFHGEQYPVAKNNSPANRARNRRVNIELDRVAVVEKPVEKPAEKAPEPTAPAPAVK